MRRLALHLAVALFGAAVALAAPTLTPAAHAVTGAEAEQRLFELINAQRVANGVAPLQRLAGIDAVAVQWSTHMANGGCGYRWCHRKDLLTPVEPFLAPYGGWTSLEEFFGLGPAPDYLG